MLSSVHGGLQSIGYNKRVPHIQHAVQGPVRLGRRVGLKGRVERKVWRSLETCETVPPRTGQRLGPVAGMRYDYRDAQGVLLGRSGAVGVRAHWVFGRLPCMRGLLFVLHLSVFVAVRDTWVAA